jgi:hypothetical protein
MTFTYKTLGQSAPAAITLTDAYTVPAATSAIIESVTIANRDSSATTVRVAVSVGGGAIANKDYVMYDVQIPGNTTVDYNGVITMAATDKLRVYSTSGLVSFNAFGVEVT